MKKLTTLFLTLFILITAYAPATAQINFEDYFFDKTLRTDYTIGGNNEKSHLYFVQFKEEPYWGGSLVNLIDTFNYGDYRVQLFDSTQNKLIYSRGFSNLFVEWQDTKEARQTPRSFYESVTTPYPKKPAVLKIQERQFDNAFKTVFTLQIKPDNIAIKKDKQTRFETTRIHYSGDHHKKLDVVIIPDGYTINDSVKFIEDCERFADYFFEVEPFKTHKDKVNFHAVNAWSEESGTDIPGKDIRKNTILDSHFYTFGTERYLTTQNIKTLRDLAAYTPYDQIYILVNTPKYGGGGIYNYYNLCSADHKLSGPVFTHEFGHAFAALADEYAYGFETAEELYNMSVEPWQVNITNLVNFEEKWIDLVKEDTPIPTRETHKFKNIIGAFEGAGYVKKGIYRPMQDCKMHSNNTNQFCPVCHKAVLDLLLFYSE
ncbi:MAG: M64 family metallopeptidase [Bacteroidota bacterium]|nr:M64 family metallopeptidase [Bacteroidota bacterium]